MANALASLIDEDRPQLQLDAKEKGRLNILTDVLDLAAEKKQICIQKAWKFMRRDGRVVIVRYLFEKIAA